MHAVSGAGDSADPVCSAITVAMQRVLFLCTGNYYRSRFAEFLFNHQARERGLAWTADSSGLNVPYGNTVNIGPISRHALDGLRARGFVLPECWRMPRQVTEDELTTSSLVVALNESEHRPLMQQLHPQFASRITYWRVPDVQELTPQLALADLEENLGRLLSELSRSAIHA